MTAEEFLKLKPTFIQINQKCLLLLILSSLHNEDLTNTTDEDNDEQESMKISMDMGLEYGTKFLAFLEQQEEWINEENVISFRKIKNCR